MYLPPGVIFGLVESSANFFFKDANKTAAVFLWTQLEDIEPDDCYLQHDGATAHTSRQNIEIFFLKSKVYVDKPTTIAQLRCQ